MSKSQNQILESSRLLSKIEKEINERINQGNNYPKHDLRLTTDNNRILISNIKCALDFKQLNSISRIVGLKSFRIVPKHTHEILLVYYDEKNEFKEGGNL